MSQYARNHPDEPVSHDWFKGAKRVGPCQVSLVAAAFSEHMQKCNWCKATVLYWSQPAKEGEVACPPTKLCDEGHRLLAAMFN